jgi:hypothetical protein
MKVRGCILAPAAFAFLVFPLLARADFNGFGDFSGFTINQHDSAAAPSISGGVLQLTTASDFEDRSVFNNTSQDIRQFTASFSYRAVPNADGNGGGATFTIQNTASGPSTVETTVQGFNTQNVGYFGIANSAAISFELRDFSSSGSGLYTGGSYNASGAATNPIIFSTGDLINATISYNGTLLTESLHDTVSGGSFNTSYVVNLPAVIGSQSAYVGFTAGSPGTMVQQYFSNFQYTASVPEPTSACILLLGAVGLVRRR